MTFATIGAIAAEFTHGGVGPIPTILTEAVVALVSAECDACILTPHRRRGRRKRWHRRWRKAWLRWRSARGWSAGRRVHISWPTVGAVRAVSADRRDRPRTAVLTRRVIAPVGTLIIGASVVAAHGRRRWGKGRTWWGQRRRSWW